MTRGLRTRDVSRTVELLGWRLFQAMPLYLKFLVVLVIAYAAAMTSLTALIAVSGAPEAGVTLVMAVLGWAFALVVVPTWIGSKYVDT